MQNAPSGLRFTSQLEFNRYHASVLDSISRRSDPRNLECFHKVAYRNAYLFLLLDGLVNAEVQEETPINDKESMQALEALHKTTSAPRRTSKSAIPDLRIRMLHSVAGILKRNFPVLHELKKAASRKNTYLNGFPLFSDDGISTAGEKALSFIARSLKIATAQAEAQARILFLATSEYTHPQMQLILIASVGRWFSVKLQGREDGGQTVADLVLVLESLEEEENELQIEMHERCTKGRRMKWRLKRMSRLLQVSLVWKNSTLKYLDSMRNIPKQVDDGMLFTEKDVPAGWSCPVMMDTKIGIQVLAEMRRVLRNYSETRRF